MRKLLSLIIIIASGFVSSAQTASSLFWRSDSLQVAEIVSETGNQYNKVGHHGPAVENSHMALRIYFNDSGAIDLYSKSGRGMELDEYLWYPDTTQIAAGAGYDEYIVGKTVGFGGIALWDGEKEVKLVATKGRTARVGDTKKGSFAEMIAYGVEYMGSYVDISMRIEVQDNERSATVTAEELSGKDVMFLTGVNFHEGQKVTYGDGHIVVWGRHPVKNIDAPSAIGAGLLYSKRDFPVVEKADDIVRVISKPVSKVKTTLIGASSKEAELNNAKRFESYIIK